MTCLDAQIAEEIQQAKPVSTTMTIAIMVTAIVPWLIGAVEIVGYLL